MSDTEQEQPWTRGPWAEYYGHVFGDCPTGCPEVSGTELIVHRPLTRPGAAANRPYTGFARREDAILTALAPEMAEAILACVAGWNASDGETSGPNGDEQMHAVAEKLLGMGATLPAVEWDESYGW